jgi:hypothetical protein
VSDTIGSTDWDYIASQLDLLKKYKEALEKIRDMDYRGNRHESSVIASKALEVEG